MSDENETASEIVAAERAPLVALAHERPRVDAVVGYGLRALALVLAGAAHAAVVVALALAPEPDGSGGGGRGEIDAVNVTLVDSASLAERGLSLDATPDGGTIEASGGATPPAKADEQPPQKQVEAAPPAEAKPEPAAEPPTQVTAQPEPEPVEPARAEPKPPEPKPAQKAEAKPPAEAKQERPPMQTSSITPRASVATSIDVARARAGELAGYQRSVAGILSTKKPDAIGETAKVLVWFMIGRNGRVREIELLEPSGNARVDALVLDHYKKLAFPPPPPHLSGTDLAFRIRVAVR